MQAILDDIPEPRRVDEIVAMLRRLPRGEMLSLTCADDPTELADRVLASAGGGYDRQAVHAARKKAAPWLLHLKRQSRP